MLQPKVHAYEFTPTEDEKSRVRDVANRFKKEKKLDEQVERWRPYMVTSEKKKMPALVLEDLSEIPFLKDIAGAEWYQLRSRTRAGSGDMFAASQHELKDYEKYNREYLDMGEPHFIYVGHSDVPAFFISKGLRRSKSAYDYLTTAVKEDRLQLIHPYMGVEHAWCLAEELSTENGKSVKVLSPPPPVTAFSNNKWDFTEVVRSVVGEDSVTVTLAAMDEKTIVKNMKSLSKNHEKIALKVATYTSGMGNEIFEPEEIEKLSEGEVLELVEDYLNIKEWDRKDPVLAVEWKHDVLQSPSTQTWIPPLGEGLPIVEGVYEQFLIGPKKVFEGSSPSTLPERLQKEMAHKSFLVAMVFQELGYVGRCSFDLILCGSELESSRPVFVECNGRWGGTSIPMSLVNRVFGDYRKIKYRATDYVDSRLTSKPFSFLMDVFKDDLYNHRTGKGRFLFYNPGCMRDYGKFDVISLAETREKAFEGIEKIIPEKLDKHFG